MAATIRDIKNKTGLSLATISKYLNGGNVLPENRALIEDAIKELNPDLVCVVSYGVILPKSFLKIPKHGCINVHPSMLPKYRGGNPYSRVIMNGETETGVTIHFMDESFDTGDIIAQKPYHIHSKATMGTIFDIHPIIHVNKNGVMTSLTKARGKKATLQKVISLVEQYQENIQDYTVMIAHSDAPHIAEQASKLLEEKLNEMGHKVYRTGFPKYETPTGKIVGGCYLGKPEISESFFTEGANKARMIARKKLFKVQSKIGLM